ncbi:MAG: hypothetical protein MZV64_05070 [Ignavibacteriales bacterium]|nr:hypothetical protein [Ignavibacteriales bacterium]
MSRRERPPRRPSAMTGTAAGVRAGRLGAGRGEATRRGAEAVDDGLRLRDGRRRPELHPDPIPTGTTRCR